MLHLIFFVYSLASLITVICFIHLHAFIFVSLFIMFNLFALLCLFYLIYFYFLPNLSIVIHPMEHPTGFQSSPAECFPKRVTCEAPFPCFWYIGWKPGRKFRSRIRMDGSVVCTRDTTPRTETGSKCSFAFFLPCFLLFV